MTIAGAVAIPLLQCTRIAPPQDNASSMNARHRGKMEMRFWFWSQFVPPPPTPDSEMSSVMYWNSVGNRG